MTHYSEDCHRPSRTSSKPGALDNANAFPFNLDNKTGVHEGTNFQEFWRWGVKRYTRYPNSYAEVIADSR